MNETPAILVWSDADSNDRERVLTRNGTLATLSGAGELCASIGARSSRTSASAGTSL